jgi:hypothetical protein
MNRSYYRRDPVTAFSCQSEIETEPVPNPGLELADACGVKNASGLELANACGVKNASGLELANACGVK